jgi:hypothetical protein
MAFSLVVAPLQKRLWQNLVLAVAELEPLATDDTKPSDHATSLAFEPEFFT